MLDQMRFTGQWRDYQQRVLDELDSHIGDGRIHVVAAPGSGKTVLGLELVRRLARPAILLSPSLTIRDQWAERLVPLFMDRPLDAGLVSTDLTAPAPLTSATYQALHAIWAEEGGTRFAALIAHAKRAGPFTLVLDEAHHLRREWWRALDALTAGLDGVYIVSLTATPPYDAPFAEWQRYESACGPIDIEIGIPELVRNGDLCPHQDQLLFSQPSESTLALLAKRRAAVAEVMEELRADRDLLSAIAGHSWLTAPETHITAILDRPQALSAMLVHLAACGQTLPRQPLALLGVSAKTVPAQSRAWVETLLNALIFDLGEESPLDRAARKHWYDRLHRLALIEGKQVRLGETRQILRTMAGDRAKLDSIATIARAESANCGERLRMVVLADHIRASELPNRAGEPFAPTRIGVATIFETLRRLELAGEPLGVLTGTLVILPRDAVTALHDRANARGIASAHLRALPLPHCDSYVRIEASGLAKAALVPLVTQLFTHGDITMLVGTQALLGEGWDAPAINTLILASNSASFMLSNQMRGRAIRIDPAHREKVANIWHLATVEQLPSSGMIEQVSETLNWGALAEGGGQTGDVDLLARRFGTFAGISNGKTPHIESGIARLGLHTHTGLDAANRATLARAADRAGIARDWQRSLGDSPANSHVREVAQPNYAPRRLSWHQTLGSLAAGGMSTGMAAGGWSLTQAFGANVPTLLVGAGVAGAIAALPRFARGAMLSLRNGSLEGSVRQVAATVLTGLVETGAISQKIADATVIRVERGVDGSRTILFEGLPRPAERAAMEALVELLGPVGNPRYLLVRRSRLFGKRRADFHAVPTLFGRNRALATAFAREWRKLVGPSELVATRSEQGRRLLLRARGASLAAGFQRRIERRSAWL